VAIWIASLRAGCQDHLCLIGEAAAASIGFGARDDAGWLTGLSWLARARGKRFGGWLRGSRPWLDLERRLPVAGYRPSMHLQTVQRSPNRALHTANPQDEGPLSRGPGQM
jgi:hypothetical protein